jgi:hypothetical protein
MSNQQRPETPSDARLCLYVSEDGVTAYGNRPALLNLAAQLQFIAAAPPDECDEIHARLNMRIREDNAALNESTNVWVVLAETKITHSAVQSPLAVNADGGFRIGFDMSLMHASETTLDELEKFKASGVDTSPPMDDATAD